MPRGLSEYEIGIIKALIKMGHKNQIILGCINNFRGDVDRHINSGRVTEIKKGIIGEDINEASEVEAKKFVEEYKIAHKNQNNEIDDLIKVDGNNCLLIQENETIEFKKSFQGYRNDKVLKTVQGMANNKGGYILFGIEEDGNEENFGQSGVLVGLDAKSLKSFNCDMQEVTRNFNDWFGEEIKVNRHTKNIKGKQIAILKVEESGNKPIINQQSEIYYRYSGQVSKIKKLDLIKIIREQREREVFGILSKHIERILKNGIENSAVFNITTGEIEGKSGSILIDESLLPKINFINEGKLIEKGGSPAFTLKGEIEAIGLNSVEKLIDIDNNVIYEGFLKQNEISQENAKKILEKLMELRGDWFPIRFYASQAKLNKDEILNLFENVKGKMKGHKQIDKKIKIFNDREPFKLDVTKYCNEIKMQKNLIELIKKPIDVQNIATSIMSLDIQEMNREYILGQLSELYTYCKKNSSHTTSVKKAIAYIDRILYDDL